MNPPPSRALLVAASPPVHEVVRHNNFFTVRSDAYVQRSNLSADNLALSISKAKTMLTHNPSLVYLQKRALASHRHPVSHYALATCFGSQPEQVATISSRTFLINSSMLAQRVCTSRLFAKGMDSFVIGRTPSPLSSCGCVENSSSPSQRPFICCSPSCNFYFLLRSITAVS